MISEEVREAKEKKVNTYYVTGWVQVEVFAEVKAKNIKELIKELNETGNMAFEEGNWVNNIQSLQIEERNGKEFYKDLEKEVII